MRVKVKGYNDLVTLVGNSGIGKKRLEKLQTIIVMLTDDKVTLSSVI